MRELFISVTERSVIMMCMKGSSRQYKAGTNLVKIQQCKVVPYHFELGSVFASIKEVCKLFLQLREAFRLFVLGPNKIRILHPRKQYVLIDRVTLSAPSTRNNV